MPIFAQLLVKNQSDETLMTVDENGLVDVPNHTKTQFLSVSGQSPTQGKVLFATNTDGDLDWSLPPDETNVFLKWDAVNEQWITVPAAEGPVGPTGPEGTMGPTGATGPQGTIGPMGATGPQGTRGPRGTVGPRGTRGPQGAVGPTGPQGTRGPAGPRGTIGPRGTRGPQGPAGATGPQGTIGPRGPQGTRGLRGTVGPRGPQGTRGPRGTVGPRGPQGTRGPRGTLGPRGVTGPQGTRGPIGPTGPSAHYWAGSAINTSVVTYRSGRVGINRTSAQANLHVNEVGTEHSVYGWDGATVDIKTAVEVKTTNSGYGTDGVFGTLSEVTSPSSFSSNRYHAGVAGRANRVSGSTERIVTSGEIGVSQIHNSQRVLMAVRGNLDADDATALSSLNYASALDAWVKDNSSNHSKIFAAYIRGAKSYFGNPVGIGTTDPGADMLDVRGRAYASGGWQTTNADYAEWFEKEGISYPGDLMGINLETGKVRKYRPGDKFIGIHSTNPAFVGNRTEEDDEEMRKTHVLVGLVGQLDIQRDQVSIKGRMVYTKDNQYVGIMLSNDKVFIGR